MTEVGFPWRGTVDNLVVRQAEPADVDTLMSVLVESGLRVPLGQTDRAQISDEVESREPATWIIIERPKRAVGVVRVLVSDEKFLTATPTVIQSRRWGDQRQAREALEIVLDQLHHRGVLHVWAVNHQTDIRSQRA